MASVPVGVGTSFSYVQPNVSTPTFTIHGGFKVVTFNPMNVDAPGTLTLYDDGNNALLVMTAGGSYPWIVPAGGANYYFTSTAAISTVAMTHPNDMRG